MKGGSPKESPGVVVRNPKSCSTSLSLCAKVLELFLPGLRPPAVTHFWAGFLPRPVVVLSPATRSSSSRGNKRFQKSTSETLSLTTAVRVVYTLRSEVGILRYV